jgi:hypothetical protein
MTNLAVSSHSVLGRTRTHFLQLFETTLKEVVDAKRLSASKMNKLTDIAMTCMEVRILFLVVFFILLTCVRMIPGWYLSFTAHTNHYL